MMEEGFPQVVCSDAWACGAAAHAGQGGLYGSGSGGGQAARRRRRGSGSMVA